MEALLTFGWDQPLLCGLLWVHYRKFNNIPGLETLEARSTTPPKLCQSNMIPDFTRSPLGDRWLRTTAIVRESLVRWRLHYDGQVPWLRKTSKQCTVNGYLIGPKVEVSLGTAAWTKFQTKSVIWIKDRMNVFPGTGHSLCWGWEAWNRGMHRV